VTGEAAGLAMGLCECELGEGDNSASAIEDIVAYAQILRRLAVPTLLRAWQVSVPTGQQKLQVPQS
jgi:hypothetical protein